MNITRTFHTVGQGAFYSEVFNNDNGKRFIVVYDCGSYSIGAKTLSPKPNIKLQTKIKSDLGSPEVDILFISHFDTDHINGCQFLNPRVVIIPYLEKEQINFLSAVNQIIDGDLQIGILLHPENYFSNAKIIRVRSTQNLEEIDEDFINIDLNSDIDLQRLFLKEEIKSGQIIRLNNCVPIWEYLPYNPYWEILSPNFKQILKDLNLKYEELSKEDNGVYIKSNLKKIRDAYDRLGNNKNKHSLIVYSGPLESFRSRLIFNNHKCFSCDPDCLLCRFHKYCRLLYDKQACIYFGDITVNDKLIKNFYEGLNKKGGSKKEDCNKSRLEKVGTIQIPHHGSWLSRGDKCPNNEPKICVISVGEMNDYGHPSSQIICSILQKGHELKLVTENSTSIFIESFDLRL